MDAGPAVQQRSLLWLALGSWRARSHLWTELLVEELLTPFQALFFGLKAPPSQQICGSAASKVCTQGGIPSATAARAESSLLWSLWNTAFPCLCPVTLMKAFNIRLLFQSMHISKQWKLWLSTQLKWALCDLILKCAEHLLGYLWGQWALLGLHCFGNGAEIRFCELCFVLTCVQNLSPAFKDARQEENPFWVSKEKIHKDVKRQTLVSEHYWILEFF